MLVEQGCARTTTLQVQQRAEVSRGALLHHFPTHAALLSATVEELVWRNEQAVQESLAKLQGTADATERAIRVLAIATMRPAYMAELELWAVARTDPELRSALLLAERKARKDSDRVMRSLFAEASDHPVVALTTEFMRGLALSSVLRGPVRRQKLLAQWVKAARTLLNEQR
jgi:AcrR family transcriptional regulator